VQTPAEIVFDPGPLLRKHLSAERIEPHAGGYRATLSFCLYSSWREPGHVEQNETAHHVITADLRDLPPGVAATVAERWPEMVVELDLAPPPESQIRDLDASGLVVRVPVVRYEVSATETTRAWVVKTHAGSDAERAAWLRSLAGAARPER
jgi:hypothetical protein